MEMLTEGAAFLAEVRKMKDEEKTKGQLAEELEKLRLYEMIVEKMPLALTAWELEDLDDPGSFRLLACNPAIEEATGAPYREFIGTTVRETFPSSLETEGPHIYAEAVRTGQVRKLPDLHFPGDEQTAAGVYSVTVVPLGGRVAAMFCENITERKRTEEALRESEERYRSVVEHSHAGILIVDSAYRFIYVNDELGRILGYSSEEIVGQDFRTFLDDESKKLVADRYVRRQRGEKVPPRYEFNIVRKDGARRHVEVSSTVIEDSVGNVKTVGQILDITDRKRAEEEVRRHLERVEALREIDRAITSTLDLPGVLDTILQELERVIPYHSAGIFLLSDNTARFSAGRGFPDMDRVLQVSYPVHEDALTRQVLQEKRPLVLADAQADERFLARGGTDYVRSWIGVPMIAKGEAIGFLTMDHREPGVYGEESAEIAQGFASQVAIAIENAQLYQEAQRELAERKRAEEELLQRQLRLSVLNRMGRALAGKLELAPIYRIAYEYVAQLVDCPCFGISLYDPTTRILRAEFMLDDGELIDAARFPPLVMDMEPTRGRVRAIATRQPEIIVDYPTVTEGSNVHLTGAAGDDRVVGSAMYVPMIVWGQVMGLLEVQSYQLDAYSAEEAELLGPAANQIGLSIQNARLYEEAQRELAERKRAEEGLRQSFERLRRSFEGTIHVLASAVEMRDPYTAGHQRRVAQLACAIAKEIGLPEEQIEGLRMAGLIHDVGKVNVPAEILSKPGWLTDLEFGLIKMHPQTGYDVLQAIEFPWPVAQMVLQHHERMDGSGYPQGLSGEEILLEARILGVADVVEAMFSHRPYRPARGLDQALEEISQNRGVLYDPEVVDACLKLFTEKGFKFE
jgi:PAS domain S-box-containing protein